MMVVNIYRNPFILALWAPAYLMVGTVAITNDFLMGALYIMATLGLLGAYVTEFPIVSGLYPNEVVHKTAVSSLMGIVLGLVLFGVKLMITGAKEGADSAPVSPGGGIFPDLDGHVPPGLLFDGLPDSQIEQTGSGGRTPHPDGKEEKPERRRTTHHGPRQFLNFAGIISVCHSQ